MKFLVAILIASQAFVLLSAQQQPQDREQTWGEVSRDSVVRHTDRVTGTAPVTHVISIDRPITGIRTSDLTSGGTSILTPTEGQINENRMVFAIAGFGGQPYDVRITAFSSSGFIKASLLITLITFLLSYLMK